MVGVHKLWRGVGQGSGVESLNLHKKKLPDMYTVP